MTIEPWRPRHPLESPIWKLQQAEKHIRTIKDYLGLWESLRPNDVVRKLNADGTSYDFKLVARFPPFIDFGITLGEFAYQLRSALDQIIFALCVFPTDLDAEALNRAERSASFPILMKREDRAIRAALRYVPPAREHAVFAVLDAVQPYQRGDAAEFDDLALLNEINVRDKHRVLAPASGALTIQREGLDPAVWIATDNVDDGDTIARSPAHLGPDVLEGRISREILVPIMRPAAGIPLARIGEIYSCVAFDVLPRFFEFFDPLPSTVRAPTPPNV